jgi:hypothetical protein
LGTKTKIDPVGIVEGTFYSMFYSLFHNEEARDYFGFSQISFFCNEEGLPGWYLWFKEKKGAYQLELINGEILPQENEKSGNFSPFKLAVRGRFAVRYFPSEEEEIFDTYSYFERLIRLGPFFDQTGTPTFEGRTKIHESYFIVGYIDVQTNFSRDFIEIECIAPERWEDFRVDGLYLKTPDQKDYEAVAPGRQDRNVSGWNLSSFLFDKILLGFCYSFKVSPLAVLLSAENGFNFYIDNENRAEKRENPDLKQFYLTCGLELQKEGGGPYREDKKLNFYIQSVINRLGQGKNDIMGIWKRPENITSPQINHDWWKVKEMKFREDDSNVCCLHDH